MKEKDFDTRLKDALDHLEAPYDPSSWALMEQRLDAPFVEENPAPVDEVDKAVFHKLQHLETSYQPAHWSILAKRLTELHRLRLRLWISKTAEAAILLLLLANLQGSWAEKTPVLPAKPKYNGPVAATQPSSAKTHRLTHSGLLTAEQAGNLANNETGTLMTGSSPNNLEYTSIDGFPVVLLPNFASGFPAGTMDRNSLDQTALHALPAELFAFTRTSPEPALPPGSRMAFAKSRTSRLYFAPYAALDRNRVSTGDVLRRSSGFSTGFMFGLRSGKWGVEAGLAYSQKQYVPKKKIEIYDGNVSSGYFGSYLGEVDADVVSVPVKVMRRVARVGRTSVHVVAGATANIATRKAYHYKTIQFPGSAPSTQGGNTLAEQPRLRKAGRGVLENGSLAGNTYFTADLGVRLERPIAGRWTAFVEPGFRQALSADGLGPDPAKINTFCIQAGVMAAL